MKRVELLSHEEILELYEAVVSARLADSRAALLTGVDVALVAGLPRAASANEQVLQDIDALSAAGILANGSAPIVAWLMTGRTLAGARQEAAVFTRILERLRGAIGRTATSAPPVPIDTMPLMPTARRVFLCHAAEDEGRATLLYDRLEARGHRPWMRSRSMLPGQIWEDEIRRVIRSADAFLACMSPRSVSKRGHLQKEVRVALDVLEEIPQGQIYFIPVRFESCEPPAALHGMEAVDLQTEEDYGRLLRAIEA